MRKRGDVSSKIKAMAALEAIKAHEPIGAIARRYKVHLIQVGKWRKQLVGEITVSLRTSQMPMLQPRSVRTRSSMSRLAG